MQRGDLEDQVAQALGIEREVVASVLEHVLLAISRGLVAGDEIVLPGFGTFTLRQYPASVRPMPDGRKVEVPPRASPGFRPAEKLKNRVQRAQRHDECGS